MTDITKRLAEALRELIAGDFVQPHCVAPLSDLLADCDRTAAQEANVQGENGLSDDGVERLAKIAGWNNRSYMTPKGYHIWCDRMRHFVALAAPHPTPAPASGEVFNILLGMRARLSNYRDDGSVNREAGFWLMQEIGTALTIEAATARDRGKEG